MSSQQQQVPIVVLKEGTTETKYKEAQRNNITAAKTVAEIVRTSLGPRDLSQKITEWASSLSGRTQLSAEKFADGIETIPLVLAENADMDLIDTQVQLRAKSTMTEKVQYGISAIDIKVTDLKAKDIYEPLAVKEQVINTATETACMILRIDDVIAASKSKDMPKAGGGYGGGAGCCSANGMPDMDM